MKKEKALEAITINPAKILGIDEKVGSIEIGKDADIVIWDNDPFELQSNVLVRKPIGIETAGSLNILFSDKTGTITKGELRSCRILWW